MSILLHVWCNRGAGQQRLQNSDISNYISENVPHETYAVMEATRNWLYFYDLIGEHVERVELAHAKEVRSIAAAAVKTDQIDATVLAHLARLNFLPTAYAVPKGFAICASTYVAGTGWLDSAEEQRTGYMQTWLVTIYLHEAQPSVP